MKMIKISLLFALMTIGLYRVEVQAFTNPPVEDTSMSLFKINVLSFNTALLEILAQDFFEEFLAFFKGDYGDVSEKNDKEAKQRDRRGELIGELVNPFDVVVFEEAFDRSARKALLKSAGKYFNYSTGILGSGLRSKFFPKEGTGDCLKDWHLHPDKNQMGRAYFYEDLPDKIINIKNISDAELNKLHYGEQHMCVVGDLGNDGGVMIISKENVAMKGTGEFIFSANRHPINPKNIAKNPDLFANKGVVYAKLEKRVPTFQEFCKKELGRVITEADAVASKDPKVHAFWLKYKEADLMRWQGKTFIYHVFGTHLQACYRGKSEEWKEEYRVQMKKEIDELKKFIDTYKIPDTQPIFIVGDMNILDPNVNPQNENFKKEFKGVAYEKELYDYMVKTLNVFIPPLEGATYNPELDFKKEMPTSAKVQRIDYVMIVKNRAYSQLNRSFNKIYAARAKSAWGEKDGKKKYSLSDHEPMYGFFEFAAYAQ